MQTASYFDIFGSDLSTLIEFFEQAIKFTPKHQFVPMRARITHFQRPAIKSQFRYMKGSGWRRHHGHFLLRIC